MKGFTKNKKFIPMTDYKKVARKARDTKTKGVVIRKSSDRDTFPDAILLKNNLESFNRNHSPQIEWTDVGGKNKFLVVKGTQKKISSRPVSRLGAIELLDAINTYLLHQETGTRRKKDEDKTLNEMFEERGLNKSFFEEQQILQAQKNPKNIGRRGHEQLVRKYWNDKVHPMGSSSGTMIARKDLDPDGYKKAMREL